MSRREQKRREQIKKCLDLYAVELREDFNIRLFCETEEESSIQEQVLWIEDITLTEVVYPEKKRQFLIMKKIKTFLLHFLMTVQRKK